MPWYPRINSPTAEANLPGGGTVYNDGTMTDLTLWVDDATGDRNNPGTQAEPFKSPNDVTDLLDAGALGARHVIVNIAPGTYDGVPRLPARGGAGGVQALVCTIEWRGSMVAAAPAAGATTGAITSAVASPGSDGVSDAETLINKTGAGWTANAVSTAANPLWATFKRAGVHRVFPLPIRKYNTATQLRIACPWLYPALAAGDVIDFWQPGVIIRGVDDGAGTRKCTANGHGPGWAEGGDARNSQLYYGIWFDCALFVDDLVGTIDHSFFGQETEIKGGHVRLRNCMGTSSVRFTGWNRSAHDTENSISGLQFTPTLAAKDDPRIEIQMIDGMLSVGDFNNGGPGYYTMEAPICVDGSPSIAGIRVQGEGSFLRAVKNGTNGIGGSRVTNLVGNGNSGFGLLCVNDGMASVAPGLNTLSDAAVGAFNKDIAVDAVDKQWTELDAARAAGAGGLYCLIADGLAFGLGGRTLTAHSNARVQHYDYPGMVT